MKNQIKRRLWKDRLAQEMRNPGFKHKFEQAREEASLAVEIAQARERAGLTQAELARAIGTTQSVVSRIEQGGQNLTMATLRKIAQAVHRRLFVALRPAQTQKA